MWLILLLLKPRLWPERNASAVSRPVMVDLSQQDR
jgi:hypothetical protein